MAGTGYKAGSNREEQGGALLTIGGQLDIVTTEGGVGVSVDGVPTTPANALVGVTATAAEINKLHSVTGGTARASSAVVLDANKAIDAVRTAALKLGTSGSETDYTAEVVALDDVATDATFVVGAEGGNVINVAVQLKNADGSNVASARALRAWLSSTNAAPFTIVGTAPDTTVAIGANGAIINAEQTRKDFTLCTNATGAVDLNITESANTAAQYLVVELPNGKLKVSGAIDFA